MSVRRSAWLVSALSVAAAVAVGAATGARDAPTATTHVQVGAAPPNAFVFVPDAVTINAGDTVQWDWFGGTHTVTSGDPGTCAPSAGFDSGIQSLGMFTHTFTTPGVYTYICQLHCVPGGAGMTGTVTVNGPTATTVRRLAASAGAAGVVVSWRTTTEVGVLGFHVFRGNVRLTGTPVAAAGRAAGATYSFRDRAGKAGARYRLQVVRANGSRSWSGTAVIAR